MAQQPPEKKPTKPADVINMAYLIALILANCFLAFLRGGVGSHAYGSTPFSFVLMLAFSQSCPGLGWYVVPWTLRVVWMRLTPDRTMHSQYPGRSIFKGKF